MLANNHLSRNDIAQLPLGNVAAYLRRRAKTSNPCNDRNQQYSIVALTNAAGTLVERYTYTAYGTLGIHAADGTVRTTSSYNNRYTYTGREWDPELKLYHFRARSYDPATGGFISRDPLGYIDGMSLYRGYFAVIFMDPTGLTTKKNKTSGTESCGGKSCDLQAEFYNLVAELIKKKIFEILRNKGMKAVARTVLLSVCDGPLPIGEIVSAVWLAWDVYSTVSEIGAFKKILEELQQAIQTNLTRKLNILEECLESDSQCCEKVKELIRKLARTFADVNHNSPARHKTRIKTMLGAQVDDMFELAKACCDMSPCRKPTENQRNYVDMANREKYGRLTCEVSGKRVCTKSGLPNSREFDHHPTPWAGGGLTITDNLQVTSRTVNRKNKHH